MKSDMGGAAAVLAVVVAAAQLRLPGRGGRHAADGGEPALGQRLPALRRAHDCAAGARSRSPTPTPRAGWSSPTPSSGRRRTAPTSCSRSPRSPADRSSRSARARIGAMGEPALRDRVAELARPPVRRCGRCRCRPTCVPGLDSPVADLVNVPGDRWGAMLVAGLFLAEFMPPGDARGCTSTSPDRRGTPAPRTVTPRPAAPERPSARCSRHWRTSARTVARTLRSPDAPLPVAGPTRRPVPRGRLVRHRPDRLAGAAPRRPVRDLWRAPRAPTAAA